MEKQITVECGNDLSWWHLAFQWYTAIFVALQVWVSLKVKYYGTMKTLFLHQIIHRGQINFYCKSLDTNRVITVKTLKTLAKKF